MDLDAARRARTTTKGDPEPLVLGGQTICMLPTELSLDVLEPLTAVNVDIALLIRNVIDAFKSDNAEESGLKLLDAVVDLVVLNPKLPAELVAAAKEMLRRLLQDDGYEAFVAERPSKEDVAELVRGLFRKYGWGLGESKPSSAGSSDGTTSTPTGPTTIPVSISTESGSVPEIPGSSGFVDSLPSPDGSATAPS
ncbi:hypothetical protein ACFWYW_47140 [Nonomuraea sp. NPDC059023]|uniref:hypothetical protein n=1 Tax=unclassified Nonomuraea TaxID=2593643 RepID=UPI00369ED740